MDRENLTVLGVVAVIVVGAFLAAHFIQRDRVLPDPVCDVSVRSLAADPEFYSGKKVRLSFDGLEDGPDSHTLVFRRRADQPPLVVFKFSSDLAERSGKFTGTCVGRDGDRCLVTDCRLSK